MFCRKKFARISSSNLENSAKFATSNLADIFVFSFVLVSRIEHSLLSTHLSEKRMHHDKHWEMLAKSYVQLQVSNKGKVMIHPHLRTITCCCCFVTAINFHYGGEMHRHHISFDYSLNKLQRLFPSSKKFSHKIQFHLRKSILSSA